MLKNELEVICNTAVRERLMHIRTGLAACISIFRKDGSLEMAFFN